MNQNQFSDFLTEQLSASPKTGEAVLKLKNKRGDDRGDFILTISENSSPKSKQSENDKENRDLVDAFCTISVKPINKVPSSSDYFANNTALKTVLSKALWWNCINKESLGDGQLSSESWKAVVENGSASAPSFHDFPETVKFLIIKSAWNIADCAFEQYSLRCSCVFARDCCSRLISSLRLDLGGALAEGCTRALQNLTWFPLQSSLTHLQLRCTYCIQLVT
jgi:hypothetical protein